MDLITVEFLGDYAPIHALVVSFVRFGILCASVLALVIIDLALGWKRAKELGIARRSRGFSRTLGKLSMYFVLLMATSVGDISMIVVELYVYPYISLVLTMVIFLREIKSIWEKFSRDEQKALEQSAKGIAHIAKSRGDIEQIAQMAIQYFEDKEQQG